MIIYLNEFSILKCIKVRSVKAFPIPDLSRRFVLYFISARVVNKINKFEMKSNKAFPIPVLIYLIFKQTIDF